MQLIAWKDSFPNDLLCVEWDVKPYTLTHSLVILLGVVMVSSREVMGLTPGAMCGPGCCRREPMHFLPGWHEMCPNQALVSLDLVCFVYVTPFVCIGFLC